MKTAPISRLAKDTILEAIQAASTASSKATTAWIDGVPAKAANTLEWLHWAAELVRHDEHDSTLLLRIGGCIVALEDMGEAMTRGSRVADLQHAPAMQAAADRLRLASLLLQAARRQADLEVRLRAILPDAQGIADMADEAPADRAGDIIINARRIAQIARA